MSERAEAISGSVARAPRATAPLPHRLLALATAAACGLVLLIAAGLDYDPAGHGTHTQLGMPACGWAVTLDFPCPTCGMTTSFTAAADAEPIRAFRTQPLGAVLALATAGLFWGGLWQALTGDRLGAIALRWLQPRTLWLLGALAAASWVFKIVTW